MSSHASLIAAFKESKREMWKAYYNLCDTKTSDNFFPQAVANLKDKIGKMALSLNALEKYENENSAEEKAEPVSSLP